MVKLRYAKLVNKNVKNWDEINANDDNDWMGNGNAGLTLSLKRL